MIKFTFMKKCMSAGTHKTISCRGKQYKLSCNLDPVQGKTLVQRTIWNVCTSCVSDLYVVCMSRKTSRRDARKPKSPARRPAKCFGVMRRHEVRRKTDIFPVPLHTQSTKHRRAYFVGVLGLANKCSAIWAKMSFPSAAAALRESFGDRRPPDISRKITACVSCRKLKVQRHG